jgi:hypothetical protein
LAKKAGTTNSRKCTKVHETAADRCIRLRLPSKRPDQRAGHPVAIAPGSDNAEGLKFSSLFAADGAEVFVETFCGDRDHDLTWGDVAAVVEHHLFGSPEQLEERFALRF